MDPRRCASAEIETGGYIWRIALATLLTASVLLTGCNDTRDDDPDTVIAAGSVAPPTAVDRYLAFADSVRAADAMSGDHEYTAAGIRHLAAALEAVGTSSGADIGRELEALRRQADSLQQDPESTSHAASARRAFVSLAGLMRAVQQARFPELEGEVGSVSDAAAALRGDQRLLEQRDAVQAFFDRAAVALRGMAERRG